MDINKIKELAEGYLQEQVDLLMRFTSVDSESNYVEGNRQVIDMARAVHINDLPDALHLR